MSELDHWIAEARAVPCIDVLERRGVASQLRRAGAERVGPCPVCGGVDRFQVNTRKNVWMCRFAGKGGDAIALVRYLDGCDFLAAVETLTGRRPERQPSPQEIAEREAREEAQRQERLKAEGKYREAQVVRARKIWEGATARYVLETYLRHRCQVVGRQVSESPPLIPDTWHLPHGAKLRGHERVGYYALLESSNRHELVWEGPAMVAAIQGMDGRFEGAHVTWIDPRILAGRAPLDPKGKAKVRHPETGETLPAKKVIGSKRAGHIHLGGPQAPKRLVVGEGIETVLKFRARAYRDLPDTLDETAFWSSVDMQNLGGKAQCTVPHPTLTDTDKAGRVRRKRVPGPEPCFDLEHPALMPPESAVEIVTLGDGDSDAFTARAVHARAASRWSAPGRSVITAWAPPGTDFGDLE